MARKVAGVLTCALLVVLGWSALLFGAEATPGGADGAVAPAELAQRALREARRFADVTYEWDGALRQGVAYLWGGRMSVDEYLDAVAAGKAPGVEAGVDASALVVQAYRAADPSIRFAAVVQGERQLLPDATSDSLYRFNIRAISVEELRPGDLIFFKSESGGVAGVAIFERREGPNIHYIVASPNAGKVVRTFNNVHNSYWQTRFLAAGQVLVSSR